MQAPRTLAAVLFSAALITTGGVALADGHHDKNHQPASSALGGPSGNGDHDRGASKNTPGGAGPAAGGSSEDHHFNNGNGDSPFGRTDHMKAGGDSDRDTANRFHGDVDSTDMANAKITIKMADGNSHVFDVDTEVIKDLAARKDTTNMVFFSTDGHHITSCASIGQTDRAKVMSETKNSLLVQLANGETRLLAMNSKDISRLHLKVGSNVSMTTGGPQGGKIVADDMVKKRDLDKFDRRVARTDIDTRVKHRGDTDMHVKKADRDEAGRKVTDTDKTHKSKIKDRDTDRDVASNDVDTPKAGCGKSGGRGHNPAFANQMAKDAANDASGHNPPGLPHECINPAGHVRGFCKQGGSDNACGAGGGMGAGSDADVASTDNDRSKPHKPKAKDKNSDRDVASNDVDTAKAGCGKSGGRGHNPAFANQMAKDAANDASGHNPPGLPHECINPAGHVRGFCKQGGSDNACGATSASGAASDTDVAANRPSAIAPANGTTIAQAPNAPKIAANIPTVHGSGTPNVVAAGPNSIVRPGMAASGTNTTIPAAASPTTVGYVAPAGKSKHPTRVLGASIGPAQIALVKPMANTPCVWHKTAVLGASYGPSAHRVTVAYRHASGSRPHYHTSCH